MDNVAVDPSSLTQAFLASPSVQKGYRVLLCPAEELMCSSHKITIAIVPIALTTLASQMKASQHFFKALIP